MKRVDFNRDVVCFYLKAAEVVQFILIKDQKKIPIRRTGEHLSLASIPGFSVNTHTRTQPLEMSHFSLSRVHWLPRCVGFIDGRFIFVDVSSLFSSFFHSSFSSVLSVPLGVFIRHR